MPKPEFEQMSAAQKASAEVLITIMRTSFAGMQRLAELNMAAAREVFSTTVSAGGKLASSKDVAEMARVNQQLAKPEQMMEYWRSVYDVVSTMQKDVSAVMQANYSQLAKLAASTIEHKQSTMMDSSNAMTGVMKSMLEQTNKAFDSMTEVATQMASIATAKGEAAAAAMAKATGSVTDIGSKKQ
jgi:phasin family protein